MEIQGPYNIKLPIHELIAQASLIEAGIIQTQETYHADYEYIRGVMWNDDPEGHFHYEDGNINRHVTTGIFWLLEFKFYHLWLRVKPDLYCNPNSPLLARSHFGDLQFLHAMTPHEDIEKSIIIAQMLQWAEFTYNVACGHINPATLISDVPFPGIAALFPKHSKYGKYTIHELFGIKSQFGDVRKRAIGSLLHMIQDSYSVGHTEREINQDGSVGKILTIHNYKEQVKRHHAKTDTLPKSIKYIKNMGGSNYDILQHIIGAVDAIKHGAVVLKYMAEEVAWEDTVKNYFKEVILLN